MNKEELKKYYNESKNLEYKQKLLNELIAETEEIKRIFRIARKDYLSDAEEFWTEKAENPKNKEMSDIFKWSIASKDNTIYALNYLLDYFKERNKIIDKLKIELEKDTKKITEYTK